MTFREAREAAQEIVAIALLIATVVVVSAIVGAALSTIGDNISLPHNTEKNR